jgi:hypothetical protein
LFAHNLQLLGSLSSAWRARREAELVTVLSAHPFCDTVDAHAT